LLPLIQTDDSILKEQQAVQQQNRLQKKKTVQHASQECLEDITRRVLEVLSSRQQSSITSILEALHTHSESFQNDLDELPK
jgi:hypothetical protein